MWKTLEICTGVLYLGTSFVNKDTGLFIYWKRVF